MAAAPPIEVKDLPKRLLQDCGLIPVKRLGAGAFGTVFEAKLDPEQSRTDWGGEERRHRRRDQPMRVAIKVMEYGRFLKQESIPQHCNHPNVIKILDVWCNPKSDRRFHSCLIMPLSDTDLDSYMDQEPAVLDVETQLNLKTGIMSGIKYLHEQRIVHRDVKPGNILLIVNDDGPHAKLADFGLSKQLAHGQSYMVSQFGTIQYMAPEILREEGGRSYKKSVDIWSCGKVFLFISVGPVNRKVIQKQICGLDDVPEHKAIRQNGYEIQERVKNLIEDMMRKDHHVRPSAQEVLQRLENEGPNPTEVYGVSTLSGTSQDGSTGPSPSMQGPSPHVPAGFGLSQHQDSRARPTAQEILQRSENQAPNPTEVNGVSTLSHGLPFPTPTTHSPLRELSQQQALLEELNQQQLEELMNQHQPPQQQLEELMNQHQPQQQLEELMNQHQPSEELNQQQLEELMNQHQPPQQQLEELMNQHQPSVREEEVREEEIVLLRDRRVVVDDELRVCLNELELEPTPLRVCLNELELVRVCLNELELELEPLSAATEEQLR